jgi:glutaredoxin
VHVEFLYWEGCPSCQRALADLRDVLEEVGLDRDEVVVREVRSEEQAATESFVGSPTIRIDGVDVQPPGDEPAGLTCRVYRRRDGRIAPTPDPADLRDALLAASRPRTGG